MTAGEVARETSRLAARRPKWSWVALAAAALLAPLMWQGVSAVFSASTQTAPSTFTAGSVILADNDGGSAPMFTVGGAAPGPVGTSCITVTYTGTLGGDVRLYGSTSGTGLDSYLDAVVTRGSGASGTFPSCAGFVADTADYIGAGSGVIYAGSLADFPDTLSAGLLDPTPSWGNGQSHQYRVALSLRDQNAAQGRSAQQVFTWAARDDSDSIVADGGFERQAGGVLGGPWFDDSLVRPANTVGTGTDPRSGVRHAWARTTSGEYAGIGQIVSLTPHTNYRLTGHLWTDVAGACLGVWDFDMEVDLAPPTAVAVGGTGYGFYSMTFNSGSRTSAGVYAGLNCTAANVGQMRMDDIRIVQI